MSEDSLVDKRALRIIACHGTAILLQKNLEAAKKKLHRTQQEERLYAKLCTIWASDSEFWKAARGLWTLYFRLVEQIERRLEACNGIDTALDDLERSQVHLEIDTTVARMETARLQCESCRHELPELVQSARTLSEDNGKKELLASVEKLSQQSDKYKQVQSMIVRLSFNDTILDTKMDQDEIISGLRDFKNLQY